MINLTENQISERNYKYIYICICVCVLFVSIFAGQRWLIDSPGKSRELTANQIKINMEREREKKGRRAIVFDVSKAIDICILLTEFLKLFDSLLNQLSIDKTKYRSAFRIYQATRRLNPSSFNRCV